MNDISVLKITFGEEIYNIILISSYNDRTLCTE